MEPIPASLYTRKSANMNIPIELKKAIQEMGWEDGTVFVLVDRERGTLTVMKSLLQNTELLEEARLAVPKKGLPGVSTPKKPRFQDGQDGVCPGFKIPLLHDGGPDEEPELPRRWN